MAYMEIGEGWHQITTDAHVEIIKNNGRIRQIKEKFGGLRIYYGPAQDQILTKEQTENIEAAILVAEKRADEICECCKEPTPGRRRSINGWIKNICDHHEDLFRNMKNLPPIKRDAG